MRHKLILGLWCSALLAAAGWLSWRHGELREIRQANAAQRTQLAKGHLTGSETSAAGASAAGLGDQAGGDAALAETAPPAPSASVGETPARTLTREERNELLTLRGKVAELHRKVATATQRLAAGRGNAATGSSTNRPPPELESRPYRPSEDYGPGLADAVAQTSLQLLRHAEQHGGQMPGSFSPGLLSQLGPDAVALTERLELLPGEPVTPETDCCIFVAREREPRQTATGEWVRLYLLANGQMAVAGPVQTPDWDRWERQHLGMLRESLRRRMQPSRR